MNNHPIGRRAMLRGMLGGAAVTIGLPALEIFLNEHGTAYADCTSFPKRFGVFYWGNGNIPDSWNPTRTGAGYDLPEMLAQLASGGMATVYFGRALAVAGFQRLVAIKYLHPHLLKDAQFVQMFLDEARLAARVFDQAREGIFVTDEHEQIVRVNRAMTALTGDAEYLEQMRKQGGIVAASSPEYLASFIVEERKTLTPIIKSIGLKLEYDQGQQVVPYLIAGTGVMYTGLGGYDLSGPFEFASFGGGGTPSLRGVLRDVAKAVRSGSD